MAARIKNKYVIVGDQVWGSDNNGFKFLVDLETYEEIKDSYFSVGKLGYVRGRHKGALRLLHRVVNNTPENLETDHINMKKWDCRKENLRSCTRSQNHMNSVNMKGAAVGYKGVRYYKNKRAKKKYGATIRIRGKNKHLGVFLTAEEAAIAYNNAAKERHDSDFARLNIVKEASL